MNTISKELLRNLNSEINEALLNIAKKYNLEIHTGSGSYTETNATVKLMISTKSSSGEIINKEAEAFKRNSRFYGFSPEDLGKTFKSQGLTFKITGLNTKAHKMPIIASCVENNKSYKFPVDAVKNALK